jgi:hypothetical protein
MVLPQPTSLRGNGLLGKAHYPRGRNEADMTAAAGRLIRQPIIRPASLLLRIGVFIALHVGVLLGVLSRL